jgi:hypothetical protein
MGIDLYKLSMPQLQLSPDGACRCHAVPRFGGGAVRVHRRLVQRGPVASQADSHLARRCRSRTIRHRR